MIDSKMTERERERERERETGWGERLDCILICVSRMEESKKYLVKL